MHAIESYLEGEIGECTAFDEGRGGSRNYFYQKTFRHKFFALSFSLYADDPLRFIQRCVGTFSLMYTTRRVRTRPTHNHVLHYHQPPL